MEGIIETPTIVKGDIDLPMPSLAHKRKTIDLDDLQFHHCVNLSKFASDKVVSFVPPDGEFELMKYRVSENVTIPFKVIAMVKELGRTRVSVDVMFKSLFAEKTVAQEIRVRIPVPPNTAKVKVLCSGGKARYLAGVGVLALENKKLTGRKKKFDYKPKSCSSARLKTTRTIRNPEGRKNGPNLL